jgi:hypothetical protein
MLIVIGNRPEGLTRNVIAVEEEEEEEEGGGGGGEEKDDEVEKEEDKIILINFLGMFPLLTSWFAGSASVSVFSGIHRFNVMFIPAS